MPLEASSLESAAPELVRASDKLCAQARALLAQQVNWGSLAGAALFSGPMRAAQIEPDRGEYQGGLQSRRNMGESRANERGARETLHTRLIRRASSGWPRYRRECESREAPVRGEDAESRSEMAGKWQDSRQVAGQSPSRREVAKSQASRQVAGRRGEAPVKSRRSRKWNLESEITDSRTSDKFP